MKMILGEERSNKMWYTTIDANDTTAKIIAHWSMGLDDEGHPITDGECRLTEASNPVAITHIAVRNSKGIKFYRVSNPQPMSSYLDH